jgi:hypothetical protein
LDSKGRENPLEGQKCISQLATLLQKNNESVDPDPARHFSVPYKKLDK